MPHFILEYSANILEEVNPADFFLKVHELAMQTGTFSISDLKSRIVRHDRYHLGNGDYKNAFVFLSVAMLSGRDLSLRQDFGTKLLALLERQFAASLEKLNCSITCEIREINAATHFKLVR